ncbi:hypothetical protein H6P81_006819 [Aristolochia fimbriata]|uniref:Retrotransposon gag domain-containing protein n=1 Tax=Aristolochia fimbriata TaxID=158543 RepID=A0AAV7EYD6_ARIFI|nr:hypothetical protein H6P81_006819 [Aristolochia fimbriata]
MFQEDMENIEGTHDEQALRPRRTMEDVVTQSPNTSKTSIITPSIQANNFDFKPQLLLMLQTHYQFSGLANEDPNDHLERFLDLCATFKYNGVSDDAARLRLFKFTLGGRAKTWLNTLPAGSITTWEDIQKKFLGKYFPPAKTIKLRNEILQFLQEPEEHLSEAWERFNGLLKKCPNHKIELWSQIEVFYNGLNINTRSMIDAAAGGSISKKTPEEVHELIEEMTANMYQYPMERSSKKAAGIYKLDSSTATQAQLEALQQQFVNFQQQSNPVVASICGICGGGHADYECQAPSWIQTTSSHTQQKEELLATKAELEEEKKLNPVMYTELQSLRQTVTLLTTQMNHLNQGAYERPREALPSKSEINPKEQVKAITLRSGKTLEELQPKEQPAMEEEKTHKGEEEKGKEKVSPPSSPRRKKSKDALPITDIDIRYLPYPSRAKFDILESSFARFLETFQKLQINIPLLEALRQIPLYGKFLKEVLSGKRKIEEKGTVVLNKNCSAILKNELPRKLKDPGSFTIPCEIGSNKFVNALCDLGASVNLMPLSLCRYLQLGEPQETGITLQFADRSTKIPGVMADVLVKIQDFIYPCDFVVLDMEVDKNLTIILGRPFLATAGSVIDCKSGNLTLRLNNDAINFNIKEAMKQPAIPHDYFCLSIDVIDSCIVEIEEEERTAAEEGGQIHSENEDPIIIEEFGELEAGSKEELAAEIKEQGAPEAHKPELKPLPSNLKYVFLEKNDKPVIISSCLTGLEEKMLIEHLELVLERCEEKKLVLNWEKCHFMVREGIVLGHKILEKGIEVDKAKIEVIEKLPPPTSVKALRYLFAKKDSKPRLIRWILLLQEFDIEIKDKKGAENVVADHLSRLEAENKDGEVLELFPDERICQSRHQTDYVVRFRSSGEMADTIKDGGSSTRPPLLEGTNYPYWKARMTAYIKSIDEDAWLTVLEGWSRPTIELEGKTLDKQQKNWTDEENKCSNLNSKTLNAIFCGVSLEVFSRMSAITSSKEAWESLEIHYEGTVSITWRSLSRNRLVRKVLRPLTTKFSVKAIVIAEANNIDKMTLNEVIGSLCTFETEMKAKVITSAVDDQNIAFIGETRKPEQKRMQCHGCDGYGHVQAECPTIQKKKKAHNVTWSDSDSNSSNSDENYTVFFAGVQESVPPPEISEDDFILLKGMKDKLNHLSNINRELIVKLNESEASKKFLQIEVMKREESLKLKEQQIEELQKELFSTKQLLKKLEKGKGKLDEILSSGKTSNDKSGLGYTGSTSKRQTLFVKEGYS